MYDLIAEYDEQGLGGLNFESFIRILSSNPSQLESTGDLKKIYRKYDKEHKGYITEKDIQVIAKEFGENMNE